MFGVGFCLLFFVIRKWETRLPGMLLCHTYKTNKQIPTWVWIEKEENKQVGC